MPRLCEQELFVERSSPFLRVHSSSAGFETVFKERRKLSVFDTARDPRLNVWKTSARWIVKRNQVHSGRTHNRLRGFRAACTDPDGLTVLHSRASGKDRAREALPRELLQLGAVTTAKWMRIRENERKAARARSRTNGDGKAFGYNRWAYKRPRTLY